jgi:hypothetical protein
VEIRTQFKQRFRPADALRFQQDLIDCDYSVSNESSSPHSSTSQTGADHMNVIVSNNDPVEKQRHLEPHDRFCSMLSVAFSAS